MSWFGKNPLFEKFDDELGEAEEARLHYSSKFAVADANDIMKHIDKLKGAVRTIQKAGVSMWNYKDVLPRIYAVIQGAFDVISDLTEQVDVLNRKVDGLNDKIEALNKAMSDIYAKSEKDMEEVEKKLEGKQERVK